MQTVLVIHLDMFRAVSIGDLWLYCDNMTISNRARMRSICYFSTSSLPSRDIFMLTLVARDICAPMLF